MKIGCFMVIAIIWSLVAVILNLSGVGAFATWELTAWPWHWSCLCILYWVIIFEAIVLAVVIGCAIRSSVRK